MSAVTAPAGIGAGANPGAAWPPPAIDAVRRELRRTRRPPAPERWSSRRLRNRLPRVALPEALEILLCWRCDPERFDSGVVSWQSRLAGHAPRLTLDEAEEALKALRQIGGPSPEPAVLALRALCDRHRLHDVVAVLDGWLIERQSYGGF
jgi:hypothetical protein